LLTNPSRANNSKNLKNTSSFLSDDEDEEIQNQDDKFPVSFAQMAKLGVDQPEGNEDNIYLLSKEEVFLRFFLFYLGVNFSRIINKIKIK